MRIGDILRYPAAPDPSKATVDGLPNFFHQVALPGASVPKLDRGINPIAPVRAVDGTRRPAVLIRGNPHRAGSILTPWQDHFSPDTGHIRYFGDKKVGQPGYAVDSPGNKLLVTGQFPLHTGLELDSRRRAAPLIFFKGVPHSGKVKGHVEFQGFGLIERAEFVSQLDPKTQKAFSNVRYDFAVMSSVAEGEDVDWDWINARRDPDLSLDECLACAQQPGSGGLPMGQHRCPECDACFPDCEQSALTSSGLSKAPGRARFFRRLRGTTLTANTGSNCWQNTLFRTSSWRRASTTTRADYPEVGGRRSRLHRQARHWSGTRRHPSSTSRAGQV